MMKISIFGFTRTRQFAAVAILASFVFSNVFAVNQLNSGVAAIATAAYTTDLTQLGREGRLRENLSFENETNRLVKVLAEGGVRQPVIISDDKEAQEAIVEHAAIRIATGSVPASVAAKSVLKLETAVLFSNTATRHEATRIVGKIVEETVASNGQTILFVDELTNLVGDSAVSNDLFSAVAAGQLTMIGGSSALRVGVRALARPWVRS